MVVTECWDVEGPQGTFLLFNLLSGTSMMILLLYGDVRIIYVCLKYISVEKKKYARLCALGYIALNHTVTVFYWYWNWSF